MEKIICTKCGAETQSNARYCNRCGHELPKAEVIATPFVPLVDVRKHKRRNRIGLVVGVIGLIVLSTGFYIVRDLLTSHSVFDLVLNQAAKEINGSCPIMLDEFTRLDNAEVLPGNSFQFNYTLLQATKEESNLDTIKKYLEPNLLSNVQSNPEMKIYRDNKVTVIYNYKDRNGEFVYKYSVTPEMYQ